MPSRMILVGIALLIKTLFFEAKSQLHELVNTGIQHAVVEVVPFPAHTENSPARQSLELVGHRLRTHAQDVGQFGHALLF